MVTSKYPDDRRRPEPQGWHLDRKVPVTIIFMMISLAVAGFWGFADLKKDVELLKAATLVLHERDAKQESDIKDALGQIREQYNALNAKLDRLVERSSK